MNAIIEKKDLMLAYICENGSYTCVVNATYNEFPIKGKDEIIGILSHFQRQGLIDNLSFNAYKAGFHLLFEASEFLSKGGFQVQEELLQANIQKLLLEIEDLKPSFPQKVEVLTSIASGITTALGFIYGK